MPRAEPRTTLPVTIDQDVPAPTLVPFTQFFQGFEEVEAVREIFGEKTDAVLRKQKVEFVSSKYAYMGVNNDDGHILVGTYHLRNSQFKILYLDIVHELYHIAQFLEGKDLFPEGYEYVDSPIEVPAYRHTVAEAQRIGMTPGEIDEYLKVEWVNEEQHKRLVKAVGLDPALKTTKASRVPPVKIIRDAPIVLRPFTSYFGGFEKVETVRGLFGNETAEVLDGLKVEFFSSRFGYIGVNEEDGHIIAGTYHLKNSDPKTIYLDLVFALHHVKLFLEGRPLLDPRWGFAENPSTFDAYRSTVQEAKRIGMRNAEIISYLKDEWITPAQFKTLLQKVGLAGRVRR